MLMKFSCATFLALAGVAGTDAFLSPAVRQSKLAALHVGGWQNDGFLDALTGGGSNKPEDDGGSNEPEDGSAEETEGQGGSRFKEIMAAAKKQEGERGSLSPFAVDNPFINPPQPTKPGELSTEEQAQLYREMVMKKNSAPFKNPAQPPEPLENPPEFIDYAPREAKTNKGGRPQGRNRDADQISNAGDVYFAQLKRDSTVRTLQRVRGEWEAADEVFADEGIEVLSKILQKNPHLQEQRDKERALVDTIPEQVIAPWFGSDEPDEKTLSSSGISYKERLKQTRAKRSGGSAPAAAKPVSAAAEPPLAESQPEPEPVVAVPEPVVAVPEPVVAEPVPEPVPQPVVAEPVPEPEPVPQQPVAVVANPVQPVEVAPPQVASSIPVSSSNSEEMRQKIRTFMGLQLKHRGGPGFGAGRLKGAELDRYETLLQELAPLLREESMQSAPQDPLMMAAPATPTSNAPADMAQIDSVIACIEGASMMYKNSPPGLKESVVVTLRAALMSAVNTCNSIIANNEVANYAAYPVATASQPAAGMAQIDSTIACIEGAITMYKNSPPGLRESVLVTLQAALMMAVNTCNSVIAGNEVANVAAYQAATASQPAAAPEVPYVPEIAAPAILEPAPQTPAPAFGTDPNSKSLEEIYNKVKAAAGDGSLGLRSDLSSAEASELADELAEMRGILMDELDAGIPDPEPAAPVVESVTASGGSSPSKYQQMLARARAEKAAESS